MPKHKSLDQVYKSCMADHIIQESLVTETQKVKDLTENADIYLESADERKKRLGKNDRKWMLVYVDYYEALRLYCEALVHLDKKKVRNHQCLFAYICKKHPELDLDFNFFELVRTKRNGINYYGERITFKDWKKVALQFDLYISALKKKIKKLL